MSGFANSIPVGSNSVGGSTWFGSAPVPLSPLSQSWIKNTGSLDAARASIARQNPGQFDGDYGGDVYPVSRFPFTPKPLPPEAQSYMHGVKRPWDTPIRTSRPSGGGGGGNWSVGYQHQKANTYDGRMHGYSSKLQSKPKESGLDWIENNGPMANMGQQMNSGSPPSTLTGTVAPYQGPLKDDGVNSGGINAGQPFRSNRDDEWFQAADGTGAPIGKGSYTATKPGVVLTPKQQEEWDFNTNAPRTWDMEWHPTLETAPNKYQPGSAWMGMGVMPPPSPSDSPAMSAGPIGNVQPIDDMSLVALAQQGALHTPVNLPPVAGVATQYVPPQTAPPTRRIMDGSSALPSAPLNLRHDFDWLAPVNPSWGSSQPASPVVKTAPTPNPPTTRPMTAYELGAPADSQQARRWARDLWATAERTGDKDAKDMATKAVAWANLPPGQRQAILAQEQRMVNTQGFREDPDLWQTLNKYNKTGKLPDTVTTKGTRKELRDSKGNHIGFSEDKGVKPKGGTVTDNGQTMSFDDWFELHNPATQKKIEAEVAKRLAA